MCRKVSHLEFLSVVTFVVCLFFLPFAPWALANTYTVNDTADNCFPAPGRICLRTAITYANSNPGKDTIILPAGTYVLSAAISTTKEDNNAQGDLDILDDLIIIGAGAEQTIVDGNSLDRVFDIYNDTMSMSGMTIRNGKAPTGDMGGGGIRTSNGTLTLDKVIVRNNSVEGTGATDYGGGVGNNGVCTIINSTIANNQAYKGGGVSNNGTSIAVFMSTISGNTDIVAAGGMLSISNTLVVNSTISGNSSTSGAGGIYGFGASTIISTTITNNSSTSGSDGYCNNVSGTLSVKNSIIAHNGDHNCCNPASVTSNGYNLEDTNTCGFTNGSDLINSDPKLASLQNNGGPTFTHALQNGSPAIDAGTSIFMFPNDQRGKKRPCGAGYDIGAYEKCSGILLFIPAIIANSK